MQDTDTASTQFTPELLFYTYADKKYDFFAVPYVYFALKKNPDAFVEVALEDYDDFFQRNCPSVELLHEIFGDRFLLRQSRIAAELNDHPNVIRFVEAPVSTARYVYIGDIDLIVMQDVLQIHEGLIEKHGIPFSNVIRPSSVRDGVPRLSGLHFCPYELMYPLPDISDLDVHTLNDEHVLYKIMERKGVMVPTDFNERPQCGIHMSLNRDPAGRCGGPVYHHFDPDVTTGWQGAEHYEYVEALRYDEGFQRLFLTFAYEFRLLFAALEACANGSERLLHRMAASFLVDRRFCGLHSGVSRNRLSGQVNELLTHGRYDEASRVTATMVGVWPLSSLAWRSRAKAALASNLNDIAMEAAKHYHDLEAPDDDPDAEALLVELAQELHVMHAAIGKTA